MFVRLADNTIGGPPVSGISLSFVTGNEGSTAILKQSVFLNSEITYWNFSLAGGALETSETVSAVSPKLNAFPANGFVSVVLVIIFPFGGPNLFAGRI